MYFDIIIRKVKLNEVDYIFMGLFLGCSLALYLKKSRKKALMKKLGDIRGGVDINIGLDTYNSDYGYDVSILKLILKSKAVNVRIMAIIVNVFYINKDNIMDNLGRINYLIANGLVYGMGEIFIATIHPIAIVTISAIVGFAFSYLPVIGNFITPQVILTTFLARSARQMIFHIIEVEIFREIFVKYFGSETNENLRKEMQPGLFTNRKTIPNSNKIKMKILKSPTLQKAFQKFEILQQNNVTNVGQLRIDTLDSDPDLKKMLKLWELPKHQFSLKEKVLMKAKTVFFRNFLHETADVDNLSNLGIINAEIVQQVVKSQIKSD